MSRWSIIRYVLGYSPSERILDGVSLRANARLGRALAIASALGLLTFAAVVFDAGRLSPLRLWAHPLGTSAWVWAPMIVMLFIPSGESRRSRSRSSRRTLRPAPSACISRRPHHIAEVVGRRAVRSADSVRRTDRNLARRVGALLGQGAALRRGPISGWSRDGGGLRHCTDIAR